MDEPRHSKVMNPTLPDADIQAKYADDPINARAEYGAEFRDDVGIFVSPEIVDACVAHGCHERLPERIRIYRLR